MTSKVPVEKALSEAKTTDGDADPDERSDFDMHGEPPERIRWDGDWQDVEFIAGAQFKHGQNIVEIAHCLSLNRIVVLDTGSGEAHVVARSELTAITKTVTDDTQKPVTFVDVSEEGLAQATAREESLRPFLAVGVLSDLDAQRIARANGVTPRSVRRWMRRYKQSRDLRAFLDNPPGPRPGARSLKREVDAIIRFAVLNKLHSAGNCSVRAVYETIRGDCKAIGHAAPARSTVLDRIKELKATPEALPEAIGEKVRATRQLVRGSAPAIRPLERVEIDHTLVDTHIVDAMDGEPLGRPWLTIAIDVATRAVMGFSLTLEHPSRLSVALCLRQAIFPKESWVKTIGAVGPWPMFGRPRLIFTDNGADFRSLSFRLGCRRHRIENDYRPLGKPRYGGTVERLIGTFMRRMRLVPGNTYNEIVGTKTPYAAQQAVLTLDDLERWFTNEVTAYHNEEHRKLRISPLVAWERAWNTAQGACVPSYPADPQTVFTDLLPHESRAISRDGINIHSLLYRSLELEPYVKPGARGIVRTDPRDISRVFLERPEGGHVQVPWINHGWPRLSLWEWNEIRTRNGKRGKNADPQIVRQCLAENDQLIAERAAQGKLRARRRRARATRWGTERGLEGSAGNPSRGDEVRSRASAPTEMLPPLPRTQPDVVTASVESPIPFEVLE